MSSFLKCLKASWIIILPLISYNFSYGQTVDNEIRFTEEFKFKSEIFQITVNPTENEGLNIALSAYVNNKKLDTTFLLLQLKEEIFLTKLHQVIEKKFYNVAFSNEERIWLNNIGYNIFRRMLLLSIFEDPQTPIAGYLYINDLVAISPYANDSTSLFLRPARNRKEKLNLICNRIKSIKQKIEAIDLIYKFPRHPITDICDDETDLDNFNRGELKDAISNHLITLTLLQKELDNKKMLKIAENDMEIAQKNALTKQKNLDSLSALISERSDRIKHQIDSLEDYKSAERTRLAFLKRELAITARIQSTYANLSENYKNIQSALKGSGGNENSSDKLYFSSVSISDTISSIDNDLEKLLNQTKKEIDSLENISPEGVSSLSSEATKRLKSTARKTETRIREIQDQIAELKIPKSFNDNGMVSALEEVKNAKAKRNEAIKYINELATSIEKQIFGQFDVDSLQIEFYDGLIKNIYVTGKYLESNLEFENPLPISFSALTDFRNYDDIELIDRSRNYKLPLKNILKYVPQYNLNTEDYSPMNSNYFVVPKKKALVLLKEETTELLKAKIYTDLVGFDDDQPNGIIQSEISKKFIINARKRYVGKKPPIFIGFFNYYEPQLTFSKIENNNKELNYSIKPLLESGSNDTISSVNYVSTIDILNHAYLSLKFLNLNIVSIDFPDIKSTFNLNSGIALHRVLMSDSTSNSNTRPGFDRRNVNIFVPNFELTWIVKPDPRYGINTSANIFNVDMLNDEFIQVGDVDEYRLDQSAAKNSWVFNLQLEAFIKPNKNEGGEIFFRSRFYWLTKDATNNFSQIQLGYSFKILGRN